MLPKQFSPGLDVVLPAAVLARAIPVFVTGIAAARLLGSVRPNLRKSDMRSLVSYGGWVMVTNIGRPDLNICGSVCDWYRWLAQALWHPIRFVLIWSRELRYFQPHFCRRCFRVCLSWMQKQRTSLEARAYEWFALV